MKKIIFLTIFIFLLFNSFAKNKTEILVQLGHSAPITSVVMTKDNRYIISSGEDKVIKIWNVEANTLVKTLSGHKSKIEKIAISPDGKYIVSGSTDKTIRIWDFNKELSVLTEDNYSVDYLGFSVDGKYLFSTGLNNLKTSVWDFKNKKLITKLDNNYSFYGVAISPDGKLIALYGGNSVLKSARDFKTINKIDTSFPVYLDFSSDSKNIVTTENRALKVIDIRTGKVIKTMKTSSSNQKAVFTKDNKRIISIGHSSEIKIWDMKKAEVIKILKSHEKKVTDIFVSDDGKMLISSSEDNSIKLWDLDNYRLLKTFKSRSYAVNSIAVTKDGKTAITGGEDRILRVWDFINAKLSYSYEKNSDQILGVSISPDQDKFMLSERDMKYFDLESGNNIKNYVGNPYFFEEPVLFTSNGKYILTSNRNYEILFMDIKSGKTIRKFTGHKWKVKALSFSPDEKYFVSGGYDFKVKLWNLSISSNELTTLNDHKSEVTAVEFSPDGKYIASGSYDGTLVISEVDYEAGFMQTVNTYKTHPISSLAFTPDGKNIVIGSYDKTVSVFNLDKGKETDVFDGHLSTVRKIIISDDGNYVFSSSWDSTTKIWNMKTKKEVAMLVGFSDGEWIIITPEGYFNSSQNAAKYLTVKIGNNYYTMDNYLETFFRPDLVKMALGGISLKEFSNLDNVELAPNVSIVGCDVKNDEANLSVKITDNGGGVGDIRLYHNESLIALDDGKSIKGKLKNSSFIRKFKVKLQSGSNNFKALAFNNDNTMQSNQSEKTINYESRVVRKPSLYALIIGINEYKNKNLNLQYAVSDALLFSKVLKKTANPLFNKVEIKLLTKKEETSSKAIINSFLSLKDFNPEDLFVFYNASHGTISEGEFFLITSNVGSISHKKLKETALSQNYIKKLIANIPTSKKLIILDTCSSQALGDDIHLTLMKRGLSQDTVIKILSRAVGVTILCSAQSNQEAYEGYNNHGLFTYVLTDGLMGKADYDKDGYIKTFELADYIDNVVPIIAEKIFNVAQYPIVSPIGQGFPIGKVK